MKIALVILLLCAGCSVTEETTEPTVETEESFSILGKWKFEWNKPIGDVEEWINSDRDSTISLLTFFGATGFSESPGKTRAPDLRWSPKDTTADGSIIASGHPRCPTRPAAATGHSR